MDETDYRKSRSGLVLVFGVCFLIFYAGKATTYMGATQKLIPELVTKTDLENAMLKFEKRLKDTFIDKDQCAKTHSTASISLQEHAVLMARQEDLAKRVSQIETVVRIRE